MLTDTAAVQKFTGKIHDFLTAEYHFQTAAVGHFGNFGTFQIFRGGFFFEKDFIFRSDDHGHAFLRFGNGHFGTVQSAVFQRYGVEVNGQTVGEFTHGNGNTAGAEIVASFDQTGHIAVTEQTLDLPFGGRIPLLYFSAALFDTFFGMFFGGTRSAADAVTTGTAAEEQDDIALLRFFPFYAVFGNGADDSADFHAFGNEGVIIDLSDFPCGKADLVAVRAVTVSRFFTDLALWQLAIERFGNRGTGIRRAGHAHSLVNIGSARKRIADGAAETGCRAAERLDLCGMVMGFVLEEEQPVFFFTVVIDFDLDGTGIDLIAFIQIGQCAVFAHFLHGDGGNIHQTGRFFFIGIDFFTNIVIFLPGFFDGIHKETGAEFYFVNDRHKCGMTAMIAPVGIQHLDFGHGRHSIFLAEIISGKEEVLLTHGQREAFVKSAKSIVVHGKEIFDLRNGFRRRRVGADGCRFFQGNFRGIHRVDGILFDFKDIFIGEFLTSQSPYTAAAKSFDPMTGDDFQTLGSRIGPLVVLTGKEHKAEGAFSFVKGKFLFVAIIGRRFRKNQRLPPFQFFTAKTFNIVDIKDTQRFQGRNAQSVHKILADLFRFNIESVFFLDDDPFDFAHYNILLLDICKKFFFCHDMDPQFCRFIQLGTGFFSGDKMVQIPTDAA